jgi:hypothetical protein
MVTTTTSPGRDASPRQWLAGHRRAATDRIAAILGGDLRAARRVVSRLTPAQRWVAGDGDADADARAVLGSYVIHQGKPRVRVKALMAPVRGPIAGNAARGA